MSVLADAACIKVLTNAKIIVGLGNSLVLLHLEPSDGQTHRVSAPLPRFKHKINGIDASRLSDGSWQVVFHAGRDIYSLVLNEDNTFTEVTKVCIYNLKEDMQFDAPTGSLMVFAKRRLNDWISSLKLLDCETLCAVTGHGVAICFQLVFGHWTMVDQCCCEDSSTLYCSHLVGSSWQDVLCLCGTALGLLITWKVSGPRRGQILSSIRAHNGVVFSIDCNLERNLLTTTSDDRSVKFWTMEAQQDDRFELKEQSYCFGHTARVFRCRIIESGWVVSVGEDSNACLWDPEGNLVVRKRLEDGATLWNVDYDADTKTLFTCASNGNVAQFCIERYLVSDRGQQEVKDITPDLGGANLTKMKFLFDGSLVAVTDRNQIVLLREGGEPEVVEQLEGFKCSILEVCQDRIYVAGDRSLNIYELVKGQISLMTSHKIDFNLDAFEPEETSAKATVIRSLVCSSLTVFACDNDGRCLAYDRDLAQLKSCHRLPKIGERWLTSGFTQDNRILLADRNGNLYLYQSDGIDPVFKLPRPHGNLGITQIRLEEHTAEGCYLSTSGHDGHVRTIFLNPLKNTLRLCGAEKVPISWIDRMVPGNAGSDLRLMGFNDSHFVVCDQSREVLLQVNCGGGHRYWDCYGSADGSHFRFVYIQHKRLKQVVARFDRSSGSSLQLPRLNWHSKACNVVRLVRTEVGTWFISGGEDNILRINRFCGITSGLDIGKHLYCHISSIKSLCWFERCPGSVVLVSTGGRAQLCLTTLNLQSSGCRTQEELSYMLKASDSDRSRWRTNRTAAFDPETRFMCAVPMQSRLFIGCSDGYLREFIVEEEQDSYRIDLVQEVFYGRCLLHATIFTVANEPILVTMATDGLVCFWDPRQLGEPFYKLQHHASGINGFDLKLLDGGTGSFLIATGGDDQAVAISKLQMQPRKSSFFVRLERTVRAANVHLGQVTGVRFAASGTMVWTAAVDQAVCLLDFGALKGGVSVVKRLETCVADVKGLELVPEADGLFVYGCGFEFIKG
ncbi:hypothetical protein pipiens_017878 [Culex pipiens pipiens]|uniref:tRNA (34-2'-O)-methyltransferase regulator WDR6 n=1 Tax=Culex pipiens pipiens TaxID=38569 RepID=A0ABD1CEH8_CULPP